MRKQNFNYLLAGLLLIAFVSACGAGTGGGSSSSGGSSADGSSCSFTGDCFSGRICAASRVCTVSALTGNCSCVGSTVGRCIDLGLSACTLSTGSCVSVAACCNGLSCNNGTCQGPSGSCPFSLGE